MMVFEDGEVWSVDSEVMIEGVDEEWGVGGEMGVEVWASGGEEVVGEGSEPSPAVRSNIKLGDFLW